ncbi:senecionine N-oxygenase-like isoform X1 [Cimex lectularius]|uniref:Flavin-containing monooxygenase n=1 Tax=Cimex lectularius TaxID=79782 RepID=A0A8I6SHM7_CIMLE|nr:senecionine N-oxygenase-like isoform X1 [Cimex lectularius]XP_024082102.1 senecionine N-oxygenase-like isoform X1 [Cimex lectularius]XP_024082103.1 senecionine N-oxygenase-like isoform X1 [Cimex lectularius]
MRICIIGFGAAGITAARYASVEHECTVFEQTDKLGGTWVYTEDVGRDEYGLPIVTSMYKNLKTNLPKEIMGYTDFPVPGSDRSYLMSKEVLNFLESYVDRFDLMRFVKIGWQFRQVVQMVRPLDTGWKVSVKDLTAEKEEEYIFDIVFICNGHYHTPMYPQIPGMKSFTGEQLHSHDYRRPDHFLGKRVLVIGAGPSGTDISLDLSTVADKVILSRRNHEIDLKNVFPSNVEMKFEVKEINGSTAIFQDRTHVEVDVIMYCTGYYYSFPFLHQSCGVKVKDNYITPLYKHMININHPTMVFIGIPYRTVIFPMFEIQIRSFLNMLKNDNFPSKDEMLQDMAKRERTIEDQGFPKKRCHMIADYVRRYFQEVAEMGKVEPIPDVIFDIFERASAKRKNHLLTYRNEVFSFDTLKGFTVKTID